VKTILLSSADIEEIVRRVGPDRLIDQLTARLRAAFESFDPETTRIPPRRGFHYEVPAPGLIEWMPLLELGSEVMLKVVGYHSENPTLRGTPTILSTVASYDTESGHLNALADGTLLTAMRTGAASAVASSLLARPESRVLGLVGCGAQAVTQVHAICRIFDIDELLIHDIDPAAEASFSARVVALTSSGLEVRPLPPEWVAGRCDILCVATSVRAGEGPVIESCETRPWLHVNAIGSDFPGKIELPLELLEASVVCPDFLDQACREGECQQLELERIGPPLVEIARGEEDLEALRSRRTVFDSTGYALEDQVALDLALEYARRYSIGSELEIECAGRDPKDPYAFLEALEAVGSTS
jgi:ornithine cyclodeaminase/alanine dehydrogenase-like protein (mu-crystallin family)